MRMRREAEAGNAAAPASGADAGRVRGPVLLLSRTSRGPTAGAIAAPGRRGRSVDAPLEAGARAPGTPPRVPPAGAAGAGRAPFLRPTRAANGARGVDTEVSASGEADGAGIGPAPFRRPTRAARGAGVEGTVTMAAGDAGGAGPATVGTMIGPSRAGTPTGASTGGGVVRCAPRDTCAVCTDADSRSVRA